MTNKKSIFCYSALAICPQPGLQPPCMTFDVEQSDIETHISDVEKSFCFKKGESHMAKLVFRYGAMGASKSASALMVRFNYLERGMHPVLLKPACEDRDGEMILRSRIGLEAKVDDTVEHFLAQALGSHRDKSYDSIDAVIVDEAQFLDTGSVNGLALLVDRFDVPVICYGLRTDFQGDFFSGSKRLMELADEIEEIPTICWCGKKARFNARVVDGRVVCCGDKIVLGGNDMYVALCRKHFMLRDLGPDWKDWKQD